MQCKIIKPEDLFLNPDFLARGWEAILPEAQSLNLEIGSGYGHFLSWLAPRHPEQAFIGLDIVSKVLKGAQKRLCQSGAQNVVLAKLDAILTLQELIEPASLSHLYILFPDPWPKERHQIRRTLRQDTLPLFAHKLKAGGKLIFVSDDDEYAADARALLAASPWFRAVDFPEIEVKTKYERKWLAQEKSIHRLAYARISDPALPDSGDWPGYDLSASYQLPQWRAGNLERYARAFKDQSFQLDDLTLRIQACYLGTLKPALRYHLILARAGSLAQHCWLELDEQGLLRPAASSWLPLLSRRQELLVRLAEHLQAQLQLWLETQI